MQRYQSGVLPAGALPVVVPADDETATPFQRPVVELRVLPAEHVLRALGYVRPEAHPQGAIRRHVSCGDVVLDDYDEASRQLFGERLAFGRGHDVGAADDLDVLCLLGWRRDRKSIRLNSSHANISYAVF